MPAFRIGADVGAELLAHIKKRTTVLHLTGTARSPYLYDVMQICKQVIPRKVVHTVTEQNSAVVRTTYADNGGSPWTAEQRFAARPHQGFLWSHISRFVPTGFERTEYVSAGDTVWNHLVHHELLDTDTELAVRMSNEPRTYCAGEELRETWNGSVVRPAIPRGAGLAPVREGDVLSLRIPEFTDSTSGHWARAIKKADGGIGFWAKASAGTA
ncbi:hypothetical protein [Streptomyces sp. PSKA30]|uniref:hypothetical protein n=1 Tax=Streptomyces sp. PSKA30 TaxID=2874597 RepID=UPI001CD154F1|nr:hypothetical protein [Streptomyces sp. PSKA30]MBZ9641116.1 hypothetical protein [Streptomyces sp. PSKA30]